MKAIPTSQFYGGKQKKIESLFSKKANIAVTCRANIDHIWYEVASNGQIHNYIYINND